MGIITTIIPRSTFDHGDLSGLSDSDHDHGQLGGLTDDDHARYMESGDLHTQGHQTAHLSGGADIIPNMARIATGTYTGDGALSLAITGVGFTPIMVWITKQMTADNDFLTINEMMFTTDVIVDDNASGMAVDMSSNEASVILRGRDNAIISLDSDGFTVDDDGVDQSPNELNTVYNFMAIG